ncbi:MAG: DNA methyltransferase [Planctomycetota bacterium]
MRHRFHSICPYFAMFPEQFVEHWVDRLTKKGDVVLDPFCGRGTAPFQSLLMGRKAVGNDVNPVAYVVTRAKTSTPSAGVLRRRITILERGYRRWRSSSFADAPGDFFGMAYRRETLRQLLFLRRRLAWQQTDTDCALAALLLGILHGESEKSSTYLSNQMPRTISTKPAYSVKYWKMHRSKAPEKDVFDALRDAVEFRFESEPPDGQATTLLGDMRDLPRRTDMFPGKVRCVITSPPYFSVTRFEEDQWLRLWFLGGPPYPTYNRVSTDDRHENRSRYWKMIADMWRMLGSVCASNANVVIRLGGKSLSPDQLADGLQGAAIASRRKVTLVERQQSAIEGRQTDSFRPGSKGCLIEVDCHFQLA